MEFARSSERGKPYLSAGDEMLRQKQLFYLERSLSQLTVAKDGSFQLPEAFYFGAANGSNQRTPNMRMPLLWSQANLLHALNTFEATHTS